LFGAREREGCFTACGKEKKGRKKEKGRREEGEGRRREEKGTAIKKGND